MTITDFNSEISYLPGLTCNMDVRAQIGRSTGRSITQELASSGAEWQFTFLLLEFILADQCPPVLASNVQEWQFYISTVRVHIGR